MTITSTPTASPPRARRRPAPGGGLSASPSPCLFPRRCSAALLPPSRLPSLALSRAEVGGSQEGSDLQGGHRSWPWRLFSTQHRLQAARPRGPAGRPPRAPRASARGGEWPPRVTGPPTRRIRPPPPPSHRGRCAGPNPQAGCRPGEAWGRGGAAGARARTGSGGRGAASGRQTEADSWRREAENQWLAASGQRQVARRRNRQPGR